jgi:hypothetical protein
MSLARGARRVAWNDSWNELGRNFVARNAQGEQRVDYAQSPDAFVVG